MAEEVKTPAPPPPPEDEKKPTAEKPAAASAEPTKPAASAKPAAPAKPTASDGTAALPSQAVDTWTVGWLDSGQSLSHPSSGDKRLDLNIPAEIPGSEARRLELPKEPTAKQREIERLFPELDAAKVYLKRL